jgi:hypothetical protein
MSERADRANRRYGIERGRHRDLPEQENHRTTYGPGWDDTDPEAVRLAREVFSDPEDRQEAGMLTGPAQSSPQEIPLEELPGELQGELPNRTLKANSPKENFPLESGSSRAACPGTFQIDLGEIAEGRLDLRALNGNEDFVRAVLPLVGQTDLDTPAPCCLPGHTHTAAVVRSGDGRYLYCCSGQKGCSLTDAYAAKISGARRTWSPEVFFLWTLRMAADAGCITPLPVILRPLPDEANRNTRLVYEGLRLHLSLRGLTSLPPLFAFAQSFVAGWCGITIDQARAGIGALRAARIIEKVSETTVNGHPAWLYRVGGSTS